MTHRSHPPVGRQDGIVLITALIILVVMTLFAVTAVRMVSQQERMAGYSYDRGLAFQAAEAALREAELNVQSGKPTPAAGAACAKISSVQVCGAPAAASVPRWTDTAFAGWAAATKVGATSLSVTPDYFVEYLGNTFPCTAAPGALTNCKRYRVTARAGDAGRAKVMVQSIYATD